MTKPTTKKKPTQLSTLSNENPLELTETQISALESKITRMLTLEEFTATQAALRNELKKLKDELRNFFEGHTKVTLKNFLVIGDYQPRSGYTVEDSEVWKQNFVRI
jgi:hypothetical protein